MDDITSLQIKVDSTQVKQGTTALNDLGRAGSVAETGVKKVESASSAMSSALRTAAIEAAKLYASLKIIDTLKDISMLAARYETLGVVMKVVGNNVGYAGVEMEKYSKALQKNGIAMMESRETLTRMAAAHIDLAKANGLARIAQDAAVIGNINSSEAFSRMIQGIQRGETEIMKTIGLNVDFMGSQQKLAKELGVTTQQLTPLQKVLSNTNEAFRAGVGIAGSYEAAMGTAGKMANSLKRYIDDIKVSLGEAFGPAMTLLINQLTQSLKETDKQLKDNKKAVNEFGDDFRKTLIELEIKIQGIAILIDLLGGTLTTAGKALFAFGNAIGNENSQKQYTNMIELNKMFEERAIASAVAIEKLKYERDKDVNSIRELAKVEEDVAEAKRMRLGLAAQLQAEAAEQAELDAAAKEKTDKLAIKAAKQAAKDYQNIIDKLLPLVKEQRDYNEALAALDKMDPTHSTDAYNTALKNLEDSLTANIKKAKELHEEVERLADNITLGTVGPDQLRNAASPESVQEKNELLRLQEEYNEAVDKQVAIQKELGDAYGISANEAERLKKAFAAEQITKEVKALQYLTTFSGQDFGNEIAEGINRAALSVSKMNDMFEKQLKTQEKINKQRKEIAENTSLNDAQRKKALIELDDLESTMISDQLAGYSNLFSTVGQMFAENSKEREAMHTLEMAFAAAEIAINVQKALTNAVVAITNQGSGDPYTAFARIAAMVAVMGGIVGMIGGNLSGGGGSSSVTKSEPTATTGTVFGDSSASSQSLKNATDLLSEFDEKQYSELRAIHREMTALNANITGLVSGLIRSVGGEFTGGIISDITSETVKTISSRIDPISTWIFGDSKLARWFWGGEEKSVAESGIAVAPTTVGSLLAGGNAGAYTYQNIKTEKEGILGGWLGGNSESISTEFKLADEDVTRLFTQVFKGMSQSLTDLTKGLGGDLSAALSYAFYIPTLDLMGKNGEEITKAVQEAISTSFDNATDAILGNLISKYQQVSEGMYETAIRVYTNQVIVLDALGKTGNKASGDILDLTQAIVGLAGGTDEFLASFENYIELFTTDNEKLAASLKFTVESMADLRLSFPKTREGFKDLISSLDVTTESGKKAYVAMLGLADSADQLYSAIEDIMSTVSETLAKISMSETEKSLYDLNKQYDEYIDVLQAAGAAISDLREVESARTVELKAAAGDLMGSIIKQVEEYANAVKTAQDNIQSAYFSALTRQEAAQEKVNSLLDKSSVNLESFSKSIDSFLASLDLKVLESSFENLKEQFMVTASAAAAGDAEAMNNLLAQANSVLAGAEANSATKLDYDRIVAMVKSQVEMVQNSVDSSINTDLKDAQKELSDATDDLEDFRELALRAGVTLGDSADNTAQKLLELSEAYDEAYSNNIVAQQQYKLALTLTNGLTFDAANALSDLIGNVNALRSTMESYNASIINMADMIDKVEAPVVTTPTRSTTSLIPAIQSLFSAAFAASGRGVSSFAVGTDYVPFDMRADIHQGERIVPAAYNRSDKTNAELLAEIQRLRQEMNAVMYQVAKNTLKSADYAERQDGTILKVEIADSSTTLLQRDDRVVGNTIGGLEMVTEGGTVTTQEDGSYWGKEGE